MRITTLSFLLLSLALATSASAEFYVVPTDDELVQGSTAIVIGTVTEMHGTFAENGDIVTNIDLDLERVLKGNVSGASLRLVELGGVVGSKVMLVSAAPKYWVGNRALIFLTRTDDGEWRTYGASLGKFDFVKDEQGRSLAVRWAIAEDEVSLWRPDGHPHEERLRDSGRFIAWIERATATDYFVEPPQRGELTIPHAWDPASTQTYPPSAYTYGTFRWDVFDKGGSVTFRASGTQPNYDYIGAAQRGLAAWTNDPGSNVSYVYGGTSSAGFVNDNQNTIVFNSSTDVPAGALAYAKWYGGNTHPYKGETFVSISEGDVVVRSNPGVSQKTFDEAVTHELGHTLGFRHSDEGTPASTAAVMKAVLSGQFGASLGAWDIEALRTVYTGTGGGGTVPGVPPGLVATATSTTSITINWGAATGATSYTLERATNINGPWTVVPAPAGPPVVDSGRTGGVTYLYRVRGNNSAGSGPYSPIDHATTINFTNDPLIPGSTPVRAGHLLEIRNAVNAVRSAANLAQVSWTDPNPAGVPIKAVHILELRNALTPALTALGKSASYTDPSLGRGTPIRAVHFQEPRNYTK